MARVEYQGFVGPSNVSQSLYVDPERTVGLYPEVVSQPAKGRSRFVMHATPGLKTFINLATGAVHPAERLYTTNGRSFVVQANNFRELYPNGTASDPQALIPGNYYFASNGTQLLVAGIIGYVLDLTSGVFSTATGWPGEAVAVGQSDGYFMILTYGTAGQSKFSVSAIDDAISWNALDFELIQGPDIILGFVVNQRIVTFFGQEHYEGWGDSGNPDFPFTRIPGAYGERGCDSGDTISKIDNSIAWLGSDSRGGRMVWRLDGWTPKRISTHAIEDAIATLGGQGGSSISWVYEDRGHEFYHLSFFGAAGTGLATFVYDAAASNQVGAPVWHERGAWNLSNTGTYQAHLGANCHTYNAVWRKHIVGDWTSNKLYEMSLAYGDDAGLRKRWLRTAPVVNDNDATLFFGWLQIMMSVGALGTLPIGQLAQVTLAMSNDGGVTWSNIVPASSGAVGNYKVRVRWNNLGSARNRVFSISGSDPIPLSITGAVMDVTEGKD